MPKDTLKVEIDGLTQMIDTIDSSFEEAVKIIQAMKDDGKGRLIITGMGKSGHIGQKNGGNVCVNGHTVLFCTPR